MAERALGGASGGARQLVEFKAGGSVVAVEVTDQDGFVRASAEDQLVRARVSLEKALDVIRPTAEAVVKKFQELPIKPAEAAVEFGIRLQGKADAIIASTEAEGHFLVKLTWKFEQSTGSSDTG